MLVLSRYREQSIKIGEHVTIKIIDIRNGEKVRIGIEAPAFIPVHREEVYESIKSQRAVERALHKEDITDERLATDGVLHFDAIKLDRLRQISSLTKEYYDHLDGLAAECCEILGQPNDRSDEADLCRQIVDHSSSVEMVVAQLVELLTTNFANKELSQVDGDNAGI